ncbi:MAG: hypothetical protein U0990_09755 [Candidatus Nanopelagicales bacterium]|nr:hypothetical protein [Candidatus Nanopelagicales bacterium]
MNVLTGPNRSGKTAHAQAVVFAITGHTDLGGTLDATAMLAGPCGCSVEVELDDGFTWTRSLVRDPRKGTISTTVTIRGREDLTIPAANAAVLEHVGNFPAMLDVREFLGLSADKRRDFVLALCARASGEALDADVVWRRICIEYASERLGRGTVEAMIEAGRDVDGILGKLAAAEREALVDIAGPEIRAELRGDISLSIASALDRAKRMANDNKALADGSEKASRTLADERAKILAVAESKEVLESKLDGLREQKESLRQDLGRMEGGEAAIQDAKLQMSRVEEAASRAREQMVKPAPPVIADSETLAATIRSMEEHLAHVADASEERVSAAATANRQALDRENGARHYADQFRVDIKKIEHEVERERQGPWRTVTGLVGRIRIDLERVAGTEAAIRNEPLNELEALAHEMAPAGRLLDLEGQLEQVNEQLDMALANIPACEAAVRSAAHDYEAAQNALRERRNLEGALAVAAQKLHSLRSAATAHEDLMARLEAQIADCDERRIGLERSIVELSAAIGGDSVDSVRLRLDATAASIAELEATVRRKADEAALARKLHECIAAAERQRMVHDVCRTLADSIRVLRDDVLTGLVRPLLDRVDAVLGVAEPGSRAYCELVNARGRAIFELGLIDRFDARVALPAMSGGQGCVFTAALLAALIELADPPLRVLLLEVDAADWLTFDGLCGATANVAGLQVFLFMHRHPAGGCPGMDDWNLVELSGDRELATVV